MPKHPPTQSSRRQLALSFDVESYHQIVGKDFLKSNIAPDQEVLTNTNWILDLLARHGKKATFFFLGNVAEAFPELVRRAFQEGHEIGVHGDVHDYVRDMDRSQFRAQMERAMAKIRTAGAAHIRGHRAAAFSIRRDCLWALDVLRELGIEYDSSIFPFDGARYGIPDWSRRPGMTDSGILEVPLSVVSVGGRNIPCMGGGYVRYLPFAFTRWCARRLHKERITPICYFHPYDFSMEKPHFSKSEMERADPERIARVKRFNFMQAIGRGKPMRRKLERLVRNFDIVPVGQVARQSRVPKTVLFACSDAGSLRNFRGRLIESIRAQGHRLVALAPNFPPAIANWCRERQVEMEVISLDNHSLNPFRDFATLGLLYHFIRRYRADIVMGYTHKAAIYTAVTARLAGVPRVTMMVTGIGSGFDPGTGLAGWLVPRITRALFRIGCWSSDAVIFHNKDNRDFFLSEKLLKQPAKAVVVAGSGVDLSYFSPQPFEPAAAADEITFLMIARIVRSKGVTEYARAAEALSSRYPKAKFLIAGYRDSNPQACSENEMRFMTEQLDYVGRSDDVRTLLGRAHVFVLPSYGEGMPRTVLEAMASGRAIITTDTYGCRDTVEEGVNGHLVAIRDWQSLAEAMGRFLSGSSCYRSMGEASLKRVRRLFDVKEVNREMVAALGVETSAYAGAMTFGSDAIEVDAAAVVIPISS